MAKQIIANNIVKKGTMRKIQLKTLKELASILKMSFGPNGSTSCIKKENALSRYTKDGHTILSAVHYNGIIEQSIKDDIETITRHIVKTVGDGTTSATILSNYVFEKIITYPNIPASILLKALEAICKKVINKIKESATDLTLQDVYDISMISTNGNEFISQTLQDIYKEFGNGVFIDVAPGSGEEFVIKSYNGMTLNVGYSDSCYVTNTTTNTAEVDNPEVYFFEHPIDTRELGVYLDAIISHNIITPVNSGNYDTIVPTVIFAPKISQDITGLMDSLTSNMANMPASNRLPICIITDYQDTTILMDLAKMCGAKLIRKYIDPNIYKSDVELGLAPTPETIFNWAGTCDRVVAYSDKTVFIRPSAIYNEDGGYSELYNNLLTFLEVELKKAKDSSEDARYIGELKRRLNSLKGNMVELCVGGISQADRDSLRDLVEDAVLNVRSAANNGVGFGANASAAAAVMTVREEYESEDSKNIDMNEFNLINDLEYAYMELMDDLFEDTPMYNEDLYASPYEQIVSNVRINGEVYDIRANDWTKHVKSSIMSDVIILETVCKIIGIMATCNQFVLPTAMHNIYEDLTI